MRTVFRCLHKIGILPYLLMSIAMTQSGCETTKSGSAEPSAHSLTEALGIEKQITRGPGGRILTNTGVWSPDGEWIVYDTRSDAPGESFNGEFIRLVKVR